MIFTIITILLVAIDQITKYISVESLKGASSLVLIDKFLSLTYVENRGAAFGILQNARWVFIAFTFIALIFIIYYKLKYKPQSITLNSALCLITSGAVGNLIDRVGRGYVVDMIEVTFINYPVFNVADCFVVIGAILLSIYVMFIYKEPEKDE